MDFFNNELLFGEEILNNLHIHAGVLLDYFMIAITRLGNEIFYTLFVPVLYWCYDKKKAFKIGAVFIISSAINDMAKDIFHNPRPNPQNLLESFRGLTLKYIPESFGFPSGHTQGSLNFWFPMLYYIRKKYVTLICLFFIILIPYSRIYLGVHFLGDILGGFVIGILIMLFMFPTLGFFEKKEINYNEIITVFSIIILPLIVGLVVPGKHVINILGVFSGFFTGYILSKNRINFNPTNSFLSNTIKVLSGLIVLMIIRTVLKMVFPDMPLAHYTRYWTMGIWISFIAPYLFSRVEMLRGDL